MKTVSARILAVIVFLACADVSSAHHATAAEFDISKKISLKGAVSRVDWANPHIHIHLNVKTPAGVSEEWDVEFGSPGAMAVAGITRDQLTPGTVIGLKANPGKQIDNKKTKTACAIEITLPDGLTAEFVVGI